MKKTLSTVLAVLMILSAFVFTTGVSVSAAALTVTHENEAALAAKTLPIDSLLTNVDGQNLALKTQQTLSDGKTVTVRYMRNPSPTIGDPNTKSFVSENYSSIVSAHVSSAYKYIEVIYYYTVPEGETPISTRMSATLLGTWKTVGGITSETNIVPNQWASMIFKIPDSASSLTSELSQYHFMPFGSTPAKNISFTQAMDVARVSFLKERPVTTITGGVKPVSIPVTVDDGVGIGTTFTAEDFTAGLVEAASEAKITEHLVAEYTTANVNYVAVGDGAGEITLTVNGTSFPVVSTVVDTDTTVSDKFVTGKWATAVIDITSAGESTEQTLKVTPAEGQKVFVKSITYATEKTSNKSFSIPKYDSTGKLITKMDDFVKEGESITGLVGDAFTTEVVDFIGGKAAKLTPIEGKTAYSVKIDAPEVRTEWQPYVRVEYYTHGTVSGTPAIEVEGNLITASSAVVSNGWNVALFDLSSIKNVRTTNGADFYPFGKTLSFTPASSNKVYIKKVVLSQTEDTSAVSYAIPNIDANGDLIPYSYEDPEGGAVAYYAVGGTFVGTPDKSTSLNPYGDLTTAVSALDKVGGGTLVLLSDIYLSNNAKEGTNINGTIYKQFPNHTNLIKIRGTEDYTATIHLHGQSYVGGDTWFQKYINFTNSPTSKGDTGVMFQGKKGIFGEPGGSDGDITWTNYTGTTPSMGFIGGGDGGAYNNIDITIYSGMAPKEMRVLGAWGKGKINGDATLNIYGGNFTNSDLKGMHGNNGTSADAYVKGNYTINIYGGTFGNNFVNLVGSNNVWISGDLILNLSGGTFAKNLTVANKTFVSGKKILNVIENPSLVSKVNTAAFNEIYKTTAEKSGENLSAGVTEVTAGSTSTTAYGGTVVATGDGLTVSADTTLPTHSATVTLTGTKLTIAPGATLKLGGNMIFKGIEIVAGEGSVIDAGDYKLTVSNDVNISGAVKIVGSNTEFKGNPDDFTILPEELKTYGKDSVTVIALDSFDVAKVAEGATVMIPKSIAGTITGGSIVYYISTVKSDKTVPASMKIEDNSGVAFTFDELKVNEWGTASFDASQFRGASYIKFTASEEALADGFNLYIKSISFAENNMSYSLDYGPVATDRFGEIVIPQENIVIPGINWVNRRDADGLLTEEKPFTAGDTTMLTLKADAPEAPYVEYKLDSTVNPEWQPFVKIGYYMHSNTAIPTDLKAAAQFGDNTAIEAEQVIVANNYAIATFEIDGLAYNFNSFKFYPYGEDATAFDATNKVYMFDTVISDVKDTTVFSGPLPKLDENGLIIPYKYVPEDGRPVVYLSATGTYTGDYKGSVDSTKAYGTVNEAFAALKGIGGYVVLVSDFNHYGALQTDKNGNKKFETKNFPANDKLITVRGMVDEENPTAKVKLAVSFMVSTSGPVAFENLIFENVKTHPETGENLAANNDSLLSSGKNLVILGKEGVENDLEMVNFGTITGTNVIVNSANCPGIRFTNWNNGSGSCQGADIVINGGSVGSIKGAHVGGGTFTINGDVNVTINGGKITGAINPLMPGNNATTLNGNFNVKVTGGEFTCADKSICAKEAGGHKLGENAVRTLDVLDFTGDTEAVLKKFDLNEFDVLYTNLIYVSSATGDDANDGSSAAPVASFKRAVELLTEVPAGGNPNAKYSGKIVVRDYESDGNEEAVESAAEILIVGETKNSEITLGEGIFLKLAGLDVRFKNITFVVNSTERAGIDACGGKLTMDTGINVKNNTQFLSIIGGTSDSEGTADKADIVINSGDYEDIIGSVGSITGGSNIEINGGTFYGTVMGGAEDGNVGGDARITINGGMFNTNSEIIGGNKRADSRVGGDIVVTINDGSFRAMANESISAGESNNGSTEKKLNISDFNGTFDTSKIDYASFDAVITPKPDKPDTGSKFIYILEVVRDKNNGLEKAKPFIIKQTTEQTSTPVVVSPKQLNIKVDGGDHAILTVQPIGDGKYETIRYMPNHNPTKGSSMITDGWNIGGRGVDFDKYKYAEVIYYYKVPEGGEQLAKSMTLRPLQGYSGVGTINSTPIEANKWATAVFDIGKVMSDKGLSGLGELKQYHFSPYGGLKGPDVPVDQTIDIISLTFYSEMPSTTISGGAAPSVKVSTKEEEKKEETVTTVKKEPIVTKGSTLIGQVDKSGAFTGTSDTKDDLSVGKIVPNLASEKNVAIEGFSRIPTTPNSPSNTLDTRTYRYAVLKYYYESKNESAVGVPMFNILKGGLAEDPNVVKGGMVKANVEISDIKVNDWNYVMFDLYPADQTAYKTKQFHLLPFGQIAANKVPDGDIIYIESLTFYPKMPDLDKLRNGTTEEEDQPEVELTEDALTDADIVEKEPTVVGPEMIRYSYNNKKNFVSSLTVKDEKNTVAIVPGGADSGIIQVDGTTAVTADDGIISMKNYKYAVISYYFDSDTTEEIKPSIRLLSYGIRGEEGAMGEKTFTATESLKTNEWATVKIRLTGTTAAYLSKGFILNPLGTTSSANFADGDTLYIENITFCTEVDE